MRILHVSPMYHPALGGAELHLREISEGLAARGHEISVLTANASNSGALFSSRPGTWPEREATNGVSIVRIQPDTGALAKLLRVVNLRGGYRALGWLFSPTGRDLVLRGPRALQMIPFLLRSKFDVVASMNWHWPLGYYCHLARRLKSYKHVGIPLFHTAEAWSNLAVYRSMLRHCDAVVANTEFEAGFARDRGARITHAVGVGIHPEHFANPDGCEIRRVHQLGSRPVVGFVGRMTRNKGIRTVLAAMRQVWKTNGEARLLIAGPTPPVEDDDLRFHELSSDERSRIVRISDFKDSDKASIFDAIDVMALPSVGESFGIAYLEAWMCGKPVIGCRIGPTSEVIREGIDGLLVEPDNPSDLAARLLELLADPVKRERMGQAGKAKTLARFTWKRVVDQMEEVYFQVAQAK